MSAPEIRTTPLMKQYQSIKNQYKDCILLYRMGDFYETFFDDARVTSKALDIVLTSRDSDKGSGERIPLAGIPYHALDAYLGRLIKKGHKVAICEQVEDPKLAKGIVKREVVRVITPGTILEDAMLSKGDNNYICALVRSKKGYGLAFADISTGEFMTTELGLDLNALSSELARFKPAECLLPISTYEDEAFVSRLKDISEGRMLLSPYSDTNFVLEFAYSTLTGHFKTVTLDGLGLQDLPECVQACGALISYLRETQRSNVGFMDKLKIYRTSDFMILDSTTLRNLEILQNVKDKGPQGSLLEILDRTETSLGARLLRRWLKQPLIDQAQIEERLDAVGALAQDLFVRSDVREELKRIMDLERAITRVICGSANARDLIGLKTSLARIPQMKEHLKKRKAQSKLLDGIMADLDELAEVRDLISNGIVDAPPLNLKEGGIIKKGCSQQLDELREAAVSGKKWIQELEDKERRRTTIKSLRVGFNRVFGYYIEVSTSNLSMVPADYVRKQTLANCERFVTEELKKMEDLILSAQERSESLEYKLFVEIRDEVSKYSERVRHLAAAIARLDVISALAELATTNNYARPEITTEDSIIIKDGRHPVVERYLQEGFVPNDTLMDCNENRLLIITGPNMAGKSTYMRQVATIAIMAQMGSFVPAAQARIGIVDRVFTRVGAFDDLVRGQSTFMVEMTELANILNNATPRSLILLDEIGRGTSTFDGLSIAWAVCEYIHDPKNIGAKTLFATHYHQLTALEDKLPGARNYNILVKETEHSIAFLRKIAPGSTNRSYGIEVAKIAGVPRPVIDRANDVLSEIERENGKPAGGTPVPLQATPPARPPEVKVVETDGKKKIQMVLFPLEEHEDPVIEELRHMDLNNMTPMQALTILYQLKKRTDKEELQ